jgi:branched-chain amino acid transport system permease protein
MQTIEVVVFVLGSLAQLGLMMLGGRWVYRVALRTATLVAAWVSGVLAAVAVLNPFAGTTSASLGAAVFALLAVQLAVLAIFTRTRDGARLGIEKALGMLLFSGIAWLSVGLYIGLKTIPVQALMGQLLIGLINGSFYALLSLGLAVIFGLLNIINFSHGAQYMMGAFVAWLLLNKAGLGYWWALALAPIAVGATGVIIERLMLRPLYKLDHLYGLLLTFGLALIIQGAFRHEFGSTGLPYAMPQELTGGSNLGFMFLPNYRAWVILASAAICFGTWYVIERTKLGSYLRAATENPTLTQSFGVNVPRMVTLTYGFGVGLAGLAGVFAAPIYQVSPLMGADLIIVVFAVVVIGGMGSIMGSILTGFGLGVIEGLTKVFYPEASNTVIFIIMVIVLLVRPQGLFGQR